MSDWLSSGKGAGNSSSSPEFSEITAWLSIGPVLLMAALGFAATMWQSATDWMLAHQVLVPAASTVVQLPGPSKAGLDAPRIAVTAGLAVFAAVLAVSALQNRRRAGDQ